MQFMLFIAVEPSAEPYDAAHDNIDEWVATNDANGVRVLGNQLVGPTEATTVRRRNGEVVVTDGPFTETKEFIVGFDIVECADLEQAIAVAADHPMSRFGVVEVRPFHVD